MKTNFVVIAIFLAIFSVIISNCSGLHLAGSVNRHEQTIILLDSLIVTYVPGIIDKDYFEVRSLGGKFNLSLETNFQNEHLVEGWYCNIEGRKSLAEIHHLSGGRHIPIPAYLVAKSLTNGKISRIELNF